MCAAYKCRAELAELNESHGSLIAEESKHKAAIKSLQDHGLDTVGLVHLEAWPQSQSDNVKLWSSQIFPRTVLTPCSRMGSVYLLLSARRYSISFM